MDMVTLTKVTKERNKKKKKKKKKTKNKCIAYSYWNPKPNNKCIGSTEAPVVLICDDFYSNLCDKIEADKNKYSIFWELIKAYKLNDEETYGNRLCIISAPSATREDLLSYHDEDYVSLLERVENYPQYSYQTEEEKECIREYGLIDENPIFDDLYPYCLSVVGASLQCAELIKSNKTRVAINLGGGRHHAFSSKATGYCYINDIILCIDSLRNDAHNRYNKILYIDLDLHHPDSIQEAYWNSSDVFVASIHFADTNIHTDADKHKFGEKNGEFYNLNIPISMCRLNDDALCDIINKMCHRLNYYFQPDAVVICTGCDGLRSDPFNKWNLTINGIVKAVDIIITQMDKPTIILGGGGYNPIDTAKCWTKIVANTAQIAISNDIPYHCNFNQFAPHYMLNHMKFNQNHNINHMYNALPQNNKKKMHRMNIHAMQLIYAHLNNFERFFVEKNLKHTKRENGRITIQDDIKESEKEPQDEHGILINQTKSVGNKRSNIATNACQSQRKRRKT